MLNIVSVHFFTSARTRGDLASLLRGRALGRPNPTKDESLVGPLSEVQELAPWHFTARVRIATILCAPLKNPFLSERVFSGAPEAIRTPDARFRKPTLYPLSYWCRVFTGRRDIWKGEAHIADLMVLHGFSQVLVYNIIIRGKFQSKIGKLMVDKSCVI